MRSALQWVFSVSMIVLLPTQAPAYDALSDIMQKEFEVNNAAMVFRAGNFESLNAKLKQYAEFRNTTNGGDWYLTSQYDGLARVVDEALDAAELDEIEAQAEAWTKSFPKSASAYLGYATIRIQRGARDAEGGPVAKETIARVRAMLDAQREIVAKDAHYHAILVRLAIAESADLEALKPLVEEAARANPSYSAPWLLAAEHLITHSVDGAADLEALARVVLESTRTVEGSAQYARLYQHALEVAYGSNLFKASKVSWFDLKAGITSLSQRYPRGGLSINEFALMACLAGDQAALQPLIKSIENYGSTPPQSIWGDLSFFEQCRSWAAGSASARKPLRPESPMAVQLSTQRLAFDPKKRLTSGFEDALRERVRGQLAELIYEDGFRSLEMLSEKYRSTRSRTPSGSSMLWNFYGGFERVYGRMIEDNYDWVEGRLKDYLARYPSSPTAIVLNADLIATKAWLMRERKDEQGNIDAFALKESRRLMEETRQFLEDHKSDGQHDPIWFSHMINIGNGLGWPSKRIYELVGEGAKRHPGYNPIFFAGAEAVMEGATSGSGGPPENLERYARYAMTVAPEEEKLAVYARVYWFAEQVFFGYGLFQYSVADWQQMRVGLEQIVATYPSNRNQNAYAYFACIAGDAAKLRELLPIVDAHNEDPPWDIWKAPELRNACVEFARSAPVEVNPAADASPEQDPT